MPIDIRVTVPDLRNGAVEDITQAAPRASIPVAYKWAHIGGLTHDQYVPMAEHVIRAQYAQVLSEAGDAPSDADKALAKLKAIVLGSIRAGAASAFKLTPNDFNVEEVAGTGSTFTPGRAAIPAQDATETTPAVAAIAATTAAVATTAGTTSPKHGVATSMAAITAAEVDIINTLLYLGMSVPAMQGVSLTLTGHHFLPTTKNVFLGMKRQATQAGGTAVTTWIEARADDFDDWAFHKACHPILPPLKRSWAKSAETGARLVASGHGAAAIRIPALPSDAQAGKAGIAVMMKASAVIRGMGHSISWDDGSNRVKAAERAREGREERDAVDSIRAWYASHIDSIAFCAGIVRHLSESLGTTRESTLNAFSIRKAMSDGSASVSRGVVYCRAYLAKMRDQADKGTFADPNISA
jgi:hypothetical protein